MIEITEDDVVAAYNKGLQEGQKLTSDRSELNSLSDSTELLKRLLFHFWEDESGELCWGYVPEYEIGDADRQLEADLREFRKKHNLKDLYSEGS